MFIPLIKTAHGWLFVFRAPADYYLIYLYIGRMAARFTGLGEGILGRRGLFLLPAKM